MDFREASATQKKTDRRQTVGGREKQSEKKETCEREGKTRTGRGGAYSAEVAAVVKERSKRAE